MLNTWTWKFSGSINKSSLVSSIHFHAQLNDRLLILTPNPPVALLFNKVFSTLLVLVSTRLPLPPIINSCIFLIIISAFTVVLFAWTFNLFLLPSHCYNCLSISTSRNEKERGEWYTPYNILVHIHISTYILHTYLHQCIIYLHMSTCLHLIPFIYIDRFKYVCTYASLSHYIICT